ncbi:hypothetical protein ACH4UM_17250 [Streptomyces sp. NPDC020801]|uniref:hypothetical protein n=1 Tax=unclassified Streptomyces TaxID=2593676 RepID=UPI00379F6E76
MRTSTCRLKKREASMMLKTAVFVAWVAILALANTFVLSNDWAEYAFTFASAMLMTFLLAKVSGAQREG